NNDNGLFWLTDYGVNQSFLTANSKLISISSFTTISPSAFLGASKLKSLRFKFKIPLMCIASALLTSTGIWYPFVMPAVVISICASTGVLLVLLSLICLSLIRIWGWV